MEFHARHALETGQVQVDRKDPFPQGNPGIVHGGAGLDREVGPAIGAAVRHVVVTGFVCLYTATVWAVTAIGPETRFKPCTGCVFIGEHVAKLYHRDAFAV